MMSLWALMSGGCIHDQGGWLKICIYISPLSIQKCGRNDEVDSISLDQRKTLQSQVVAKSSEENKEFEKQRTAAIAEVAKTKEVKVISCDIAFAVTRQIVFECLVMRKVFIQHLFIREHVRVLVHLVAGETQAGTCLAPLHLPETVTHTSKGGEKTEQREPNGLKADKMETIENW